MKMESSSMNAATEADPFHQNFSETFDVIVVGYGFAGAVAAIEAHDGGAKVLLIEKMPDPGGISICSGGGLRHADDAGQAFAYLKATNGGKTPDALLRVLAQGMTEVKAQVERLAEPLGAKVGLRHRQANYPFEGYGTFAFVDIADYPGFDPQAEYPYARGMGGLRMFKVLDENIKRRGIEVRLETSAHRLIRGPRGDVRGLWLSRHGERWAVQARKGVILACGGFESGVEFQQQFWQFGEVKSAAFRGNTGDGIRIGQDVGASLTHLWHFHGSYGFHHPDPAFPFGIRVKRLPDWTPDVAPAEAAMTWILVDRKGRRFMNEYAPYFHDTGHRPLERMDTETQRFAYQPAFLIVDDEGRQRYPLGHVVFNDRSVQPYDWSSDNLKEVGNGILNVAHSIEELAALLGCPPGDIAATLDNWNAAVESGVDREHGRPSQTMVPVRKPPFYVGRIWPVVSNTQGGLLHDESQRVLNSYGEAVPGLYVAGELGSLWGHLYLVGGNLAECFISGRIAARHAAAG
jgi:succinate dehydrogenase/fumarate reductase flavoprotein subunit